MTIYDADGKPAEPDDKPQPHRFGVLKGAENTRLEDCSAAVMAAGWQKKWPQERRKNPPSCEA